MLVLRAMNEHFAGKGRGHHKTGWKSKGVLAGQGKLAVKACLPDILKNII
jgi:hypothetical protein